MIATGMGDAQVKAGGWSSTAERTGTSAFTVEVEHDGCECGIARVLNFDETTVTRTVVWNATFDGPACAEMARDVLAEDPSRLRFWSVAASAFGRGWLTQKVKHLIMDRAERQQGLVKEAETERQEAEAEAAPKANAKAKAGQEFGVYFRERKGRYFLVLERREVGAPELWSMAFNEKWERERFWDWFAWQDERYEEIAASVGLTPKAELEGSLLNAMLTTEQAIKKQGLGAGGRRPLRFWRGTK